MGSAMTRSRILIGLLLTAVGANLLLEHIGGIERAGDLLLQWWPLTIVVVGALNLLRLRLAQQHNPDDYARLWSRN